MLLQALCEYGRRIEGQLPTMYMEVPILWIVDLDVEGKYLGITKTTGPERKRGKDRGKLFPAPSIVRTSGIKPKLLADRADYALGLVEAGASAARRARVDECHRAFRELVRRCAVATGEASVIAVHRFLDEGIPADLPPDMEPEDNVTFRVAETFPTDLPAVQDFWAAEVAGESREAVPCLVCGRPKPPVKSTPIMIKGIPGGQTSGTALVSANAPAFLSYGLDASQQSPICQECAERYGKAANDLLARESTHVTVGPIAYIFWTREESSVPFASLLADPDPQDVRALIDSARTGRPVPEPETNRFYACALAGSGGRVAVRDWIETTLEEVEQNLARYFLLQRLVDWNGTEGAPLGIYALALSVVRESRDLPPTVPRALMQTALGGAPLPNWLFFQAIKRARAEQGLTRPRAVLIKMALAARAGQKLGKEDYLVTLDPDNPSSAYQCGRLLAVLERIQEAAIGNPNTTIVDRFYGTASSAPASVFPVLLRTAHSHLAKLRKDTARKGLYVTFQRQLQEVLGRLEECEFPRVLTLEDQGRFALGYYHQRAAGWAKNPAEIPDQVDPATSF